MKDKEEIQTVPLNDNDCVADEEAHNELHDFALRKLKEVFIRALGLVANYEANRLLAFDCLLLAIGQPDLVPLPDELRPATGSPDAVIIGRKYGMTKAGVNKVVALFRDCLGITGMPGQRGEEGRKEMSEARTEQLT